MMEFLLSILAGIIVNMLFSHQLAAWLVTLPAARLPGAYAERFRDEWLAELHGKDAVSALKFALSLWGSVGKILAEARDAQVRNGRQITTLSVNVHDSIHVDESLEDVRLEASGSQPLDWLNNSVEVANQVVAQHYAARHRAMHAAINANPMTNPLLPPKEKK